MKNIISVKDMTFEYVSIDSKFRAIDNLNLEVKQGEFVAIIGHNGSGKSTLSKNLNAILVPTEGDIYIDGMNTKDEAKLWDIRQTAGMVFQNPDNQIVATIVEEDVAFGPENLGIEPKVIRQRVEESLKSVGIYELKDRQPHLLSGGQKQRVAIAGIIAKFNTGLDTKIGTEGVYLSGGETQRMTLARAIVKNAPILLLDEATAYADSDNEYLMQKAILELSKNKTTIMIAHRLSTIVNVDCIYVVDDGKIVESGTHKELIANDGLYAEMWSQYRQSVDWKVGEFVCC